LNPRAKLWKILACARTLERGGGTISVVREICVVWGWVALIFLGWESWFGAFRKAMVGEFMGRSLAFSI
jgi:hypothetical protein